MTWATTDDFLDQFGLESLEALPHIAELKAAGLLDARPAVAALGERGRLPEPGPEPASENDGYEADEALEAEPWELLAAEFEDRILVILAFVGRGRPFLGELFFRRLQTSSNILQEITHLARGVLQCARTAPSRGLHWLPGLGCRNVHRQ